MKKTKKTKVYYLWTDMVRILNIFEKWVDFRLFSSGIKVHRLYYMGLERTSLQERLGFTMKKIKIVGAKYKSY